ncbi:MAG: type II secretion system F family protein [Clostridia bacterium]|nr:type II secretion system F family protein [Clostridia bacterium]
MPVYVYRAVTDKGLVVKNKVEEASKQALVKRLKNNGITPIEVIQVAYRGKSQAKKKKNVTDIQEIIKNVNTTRIGKVDSTKKLSTIEKMNLYLAATEKVTTRDLVIFSENFYLLKKANFNNIHALNTIIQSTENITLKGVLEDILAGVEAGEYMYTTMEYYSDIFPFIYINMIKVGELSGSLTNSLGQAVTYLEENDKLTKKIRKIIIPNVIQFVGILGLLIAGTLFAIPQIQNLFDEIGTEATLPAITIWFQNFINFMGTIWYLPTMAIIGAIAGILFYVNTPKGKYNFHYFKYTMPIFGKLIFSLDLSRVMKAMHLNLENGMRIQDALEVSKNIVNNYVMLSIIETSINNMLTGYSWIDPFEKSGLCSSMTTEMLKIGMQTDLTEMLGKLLEYIDMDINNTIEKIIKVLPEVSYSIVGVVLIFFVCVVLVPVIQVYMGGFLFSAYL